jgi:Fe-S cluster assembly protein SufD
VLVRPHAQKTNAFQENKNILLGDKASVDTKPQLEIFADDVKCSHGCTVGQLDEEALFYLRSRGIPEHESKALLLYAFGDEVIQRVKLRELRQRLHKLMAKKLKVDFQMDL